MLSIFRQKTFPIAVFKLKLISMKYIAKNKINDLPETAGVYAFKESKTFLYIGKAGNIKNRVKNHFNQPTHKDSIFLNKIKKIGYVKTDSEIEALILESNLIKKHKPKYNVLWKDDKNYFYVAIAQTGQVFPTHQPINESKIEHIGPFVNGKAIKKALRILRKVFPYYTQKKHPKNLCPWCHLGLCPGPDPNLKKIKKDLLDLKSVLKGKKQSVLRKIKKEMKIAAKDQKFELAAELRNKMTALQTTLNNSKILKPQIELSNYKKVEKELKNTLGIKNKISRIEAYDISNIQGKFATGSMVVFFKGKPRKSFYRKFRIKTKETPDDIAMIKEILKRRLIHKDWQFPDLILIDGGKAQLNAGIKIKSQKLKTKDIRIVSLAKKENKLFIENEKKPILLKNLPNEVSNLILYLRDEAHRFAITYHKKLREKELFNPEP